MSLEIQKLKKQFEENKVYLKTHDKNIKENAELKQRYLEQKAATDALKSEIDGYKHSLKGFEKENKDLEAKNNALKAEL